MSRSTPPAPPTEPAQPAQPSEGKTAGREGSEIIVHRRPAYIVGRKLVAVAIRLGTFLRVEGRENLPALERGALLVCNHQSYIDIPIIAAAVGPRHVSYVARDSLADSRFLGWLMRESGCVLVQRGKADRRALTDIVRHLELDDWVALYPEGTRTHDGSVGEFKGGALLAARRAKVPLVPVGIRGAFEVWPRGQKLPRPGRVAVRFGLPIDSSAPDALELARARVCEMVGDGRFRSAG